MDTSQVIKAHEVAKKGRFFKKHYRSSRYTHKEKRTRLSILSQSSKDK